MKSTLSEMWKRYDLLLSFKVEMNARGYSTKNLYGIQLQIDLLEELIQIDSINVLSDLLLRKTYLRLLRRIDRGIEYLPDVIENPDNWCLNKIEDDMSSWNSKDVLIFECKKSVNVFSKLSRNPSGKVYQDSKYQ